MLVVTTPSIEGKKIVRYMGIVTGGMLMVSANETAVAYEEA